MLKVQDIQASYGKVKILHGISFNANGGEILCLAGRNGAGKTTTLNAIMGLKSVSGGSIVLKDQEISNQNAHDIPKLGIGYVPQGRRLFPEMSVEENIKIGMCVKPSKLAVREQVLELFPQLQNRLNQLSGSLSGGEQQMLAIARALCIEPSVLLLDEPTEGLQPSMIDLIQDVIVNMKKNGLAIILVEQRVNSVLSIADQVCFIENGISVDSVSTSDLQNDRSKIEHYLGV